jgi:hypothetical protein
MIFLKNKQDYFILFGIYFISNIFLLLNINGIYWDDWTLVGSSYSTISNQFIQASGINFIGDMHYFLLNVDNGIWIYRILTFILYFITAIFLFKILNTISILEKKDNFYLTLIFLITPLYNARVALIDFPYTLFLFIFFMGFYILTKNIKSNNLFIRIIILFIFFISFLVNSFLVFYSVVLVYIFYKQYFYSRVSWKDKLKQFLLKNLDFLMLPIVFFSIKILYMAPSGLYSTYNTLGLLSLIRIPIGIIFATYTSLIEPINQCLSLFPYFWLFILLYYMYIVKNKKNIIENSKDKYLLLLGIFLFIVAIFPYVAVGKLPMNIGFESRHQLLATVGFSFIIYFSIKIFSYKIGLSYNKYKIILIIFIVSFISQNIYYGYRYHRDWWHQVSMEENFKVNKTIRNNHTFIVNNTLNNELVNNRKISFYEYNGRLKKIFGEDSRLMLNRTDNYQIITSTYKDYKQYNFSSWIEDKPIYIKISKNKNFDENYINVIKLFYTEIFSTNKFRAIAKKLLIVEVINAQK